jgi:hypothetical protein
LKDIILSSKKYNWRWSNTCNLWYGLLKS